MLSGVLIVIGLFFAVLLSSWWASEDNSRRSHVLNVEVIAAPTDSVSEAPAKYLERGKGRGFTADQQHGAPDERAIEREAYDDPLTPSPLAGSANIGYVARSLGSLVSAASSVTAATKRDNKPHDRLMEWKKRMDDKEQFRKNVLRRDQREERQLEGGQHRVGDERRERGRVEVPPARSANPSVYAASSGATTVSTDTAMDTTTAQAPVVKVDRCFITQFGTDGFGHQYEGKLSCILLAMALPGNFTYLHTPFRKFEHIELMALQLNAFTNLGAGNYSTLSKIPAAPAGRSRGRRKDERYWGASLNALMNKIEKSGTASVCRGSTEENVLVVDNCWNLAYKQPVLSEILKPDIRDQLRATYLASKKPATGFKRGRPNIVVHIRRGR
jgi:hypothetical protein